VQRVGFDSYSEEIIISGDFDIESTPGLSQDSEQK
jgi:hypothetical protein